MTSDLPLSPHQPDPVRCGTQAGLRAHRKAGEPPCDLCRASNAEYLRGYRIRKQVESDPEGALAKAQQRLAEAEEHLRVVKQIIAGVRPEVHVVVEELPTDTTVPFTETPVPPTPEQLPASLFTRPESDYMDDIQPPSFLTS